MFLGASEQRTAVSSHTTPGWRELHPGVFFLARRAAEKLPMAALGRDFQIFHLPTPAP
jgi:hypothetical protein